VKLPVTGIILALALLLLVGCETTPDTSARRDSPDGATPVGSAAVGGRLDDPAALPDVRAAEDRAGEYPSAEPPRRVFPIFRRDLPGTSRRECVEVSPGERARSGEFVASVEYLYRDDSESGRRSAKIAWSPLHLREEYLANGGETSGMEIRAASLEEPGRIVTHEITRTAGNSGTGAFYPSGTPLPGEGPWRLVVTSGPDWGCFDLKPS
jgi:hypothetical protein